MDGQEISEITYKQLTDDFRIDSEYYKKRYLLEDLSKSKFRNLTLGEIAFITDGQHGYHETDETSPIALLTAKNAKGWFANRIDAEPVAQWVDDNNKRSSLQFDDIIVSTRGSVGYCAIVKDKVAPANIDQDVARVAILNDEVIPEYLLAYLNSTIGQDWFIRNSTGMVQQGVSLAKLRLCDIPILSYDFQLKIKELIKEAYAKLEESKALYAEAENLLLDELGLRDWSPSDDSISVKSFAESFAETGRLDAEYYQPAILSLMETLHSNNYIKLGDCSVAMSGYPWKSENFIETPNAGEPFVRIRDCKPTVIDTNELDCLEGDYARKENVEKAKTGDVVVGMDGVRYFYGSLITSPCYVNQRVCQVRLNTDSPITSEYLVLVINSLIGQNQLLREMTIAQVVAHITNQNVRDLVIPLAEKETIKIITQKVKDSIKTKQRSKQLLEIAKRGVEMAIEDSEAAAMRWIEQESGGIG